MIPALAGCGTPVVFFRVGANEVPRLGFISRTENSLTHNNIILYNIHFYAKVAYYGIVITNIEQVLVVEILLGRRGKQVLCVHFSNSR